MIDLATRAKPRAALISLASIASASVGRNKNAKKIWEDSMNKVVNFVAGTLFVATTSVSQLSYGQDSGSDQARKACQALKSSKERVTCTLALIRRGREKESQQSSTKESTGITRETITLKGIPFDVPGSIEAVKKLCIIKNDFDCKFNENGRMHLPDLEYGNLPKGKSFITVSEDGSMVEFWALALKRDLLNLSTLLTEKYGQPASVGADTFIWNDKLGTRITLYAVDNYPYLRMGQLWIESASMIKAMQASKNARKEEAKSKL